MIRQRRNRKEEVLQTAAAHFAQHGFHGATLSAIADVVGLTEPGLLHYFPSKAALLQGVLDYRDEKDKEKYLTILDQNKGALFDALSDLVVSNQERLGLVQLFTVMVGESINTDHPSHDFFVTRYRNTKALLKGYLQQIQDENSDPLSNAELEKLSALILAVMDGLQIQWLLDPNSIDMSACFELFLRILQDNMKQTDG